MAKVIDESIKKQLSKSMYFFLKYFPVRVRNVGEDAVEGTPTDMGFQGCT